MINLKSKYIAVDTETTGLNPWERHHPCRPFAFSFHDSKNNNEYHRWKVDPKTRIVTLDTKSYNRIQDILSCSATKVFYNAGFDIRMLQMSGFEIQQDIEDALIMMHVVTGGRELSYKLKPICMKYLQFPDKDEADLLASVRVARREGRKKKWLLADQIQGDYFMADKELCKRYALKDAERTMLLFLLAKDKMKEDPKLVEVYKREMRLWPIVRRMEDKGVRVFLKDLKGLGTFYEDYMAKQRKIADKEGGKGLNFNSHKQLSEIFFKKRKHPVETYTNSGNPSVDATVLLKLAEKDPLARAILEYRTAKHAVSGFLEPYNRFRVKESKGCWVLHPNFQQCGPVTGRFRCSDPNLMQVASPEGIRNKASIELRPREAFGPRKNHIWYLPDYSQIEVWTFAYLSKDPIMTQALLSGKDFHGSIATKVWGSKLGFKENYSKHRSRAKYMTWCKLFGGGPKAVARQLEISEDEAYTLIDEYDTEIPGVNKYIRRTINFVEREGCVRNPYGRIYFVDSDFAYKAVNYLVQGTAADVMKTAMISVQAYLDKSNSGANILLTLHDELIIEVPLESDTKELKFGIVKAMQKEHSEILGIPIPLPVEVAIAKFRWSKVVDLCRDHMNDKKTCPEKKCVESREKK